MPAGLVYKTMKTGDTPAQTFAAAFYDDGAGHLFPAHVVWDLATNAPVGFSGPSGVFEAAKESELVAASTGPTTLGGAGAVGDRLDYIMVYPTTVSPGSITLTDGGLGGEVIFAGGANSLSNLIPFAIPVNRASTNGGWKLTNGAGLATRGYGDFT